MPLRYEGDETAGGERLRFQLPALFVERLEDLVVVVTQGDHEPTVVRKLLRQSRGQLVGGGGDHDPVVRRRGRIAFRSVPHNQMDIAAAPLVQGRFRLPR